jgi:class 3 adenylate cyclase
MPGIGARCHELRIIEANKIWRIIYRIGINLADILFDEGDVFGDGVNVASRLQGLSQPGGICISGTAFDHVLHKADVGFTNLGERRLKNIADPVRVYRCPSAEFLRPRVT